MKRTTVKIAGASGMGLLSVGSIIAKSLKHLGFYVHSDREYPSLIKGGHSNMQIDFGLKKINALSNTIDIVMPLDYAGLIEYVKTVKEGGVVVHGCERTDKIRGFADEVKKRKVKLVYLPARQIAVEFGGTELMANMVLLGLVWRVMGLPLKPLSDEVKERFAKKPKLLEIDLKCLEKGYEAEGLKLPELKTEIPKEKPDKIMLDGNMAIALGAIECGVRAYYMYPMSPASSILMHLADWSRHSGMLVKQAEDEITAAQMALGSMYMGTRAFTATSGGGYDLMTETVSLSGMIETPLVIVLCQRPGPATGLPTWSGQGDLNLAMYSSHGEFPRA
ncbi:2-oxoacid:acceptor oxidoreductase family protein, partial [Candidatus Peregrinibacteria bacterium]|nr:2-oxoacid:acceptor oxidoreductase family protein [Candidatus Peregrinibacteria bacterium]